LATLALAALGLACSPSEPDPPEGRPDDPGPPRIVAVGPELGRLLVELGVARSVVGVDSPSLEIPELARALDLGSAAEPSADLARSLEPELVLALAAEGTPAARFMAELSANGFRAVRLAPRDSNEVVGEIHRVGRLVGRELRAAMLVARFTADVAQIATRRDGRHRLVTAWVIDADPLTVVGGGGLLHELLELAGAENAFHAQADERLPMTAADLRERAPEVVLGPPAVAAQVPDARGVAADPELAALPLLDLPARVAALHAVLYPTEAAP
jgi:ABC-type Fe3+-hydroxamate transport system substrate-binding protein